MPGAAEFSCKSWEDRHGEVKKWAPIPSMALLWDKAQRMARNHPDVYELVEIELD